MHKSRAVTSLVLGMLLTACGKTPTRNPDEGALSRLENGIGVRLSDADLDKPAARTHVEGEPIDDAETAALLARLPAAPAADAGAIETSSGGPLAQHLRPSSEPPPRPGTTLHESFPPPATHHAPMAQAAGPLTVTRTAPEGDVSHAPNVSVTFSQPMVPLTSQSALTAHDVPIRLTPQPEGSFRWLGSQTVVFQPSRELPLSTEYTVDIPAGARSVSGASLDTAQRFSFRTPTAHVVYFAPQQDNVTPDGLLFLEFDQRVANAAVLEHTHLSDEAGKRHALRLATRGEIDREPFLRRRLAEIERKGKERSVMFVPRDPLPLDTSYTLTVEAGTPSLEGPRTTEAEQTFSFRTYGPLKAISENCQDIGRCQAGSVFSISFNNPLDAKAFDPAQVRITPALPDQKVYVTGNSVNVWGRWRSSELYQVTVDKTLLDVHGQRLGSDVVKSPKIAPLAARIAQSGPMSVADPAMSAGGQASYSLFSVNVKRLRVRLMAVTPSAWFAYQSFREQWNEAHFERRPMPTPPGREMIRREIEVGGALDDLTETRVELTPALLASGVGHVIVIAENLDDTGDDPGPTRRFFDRQLVEWVQVTRLAVTSFERDDGSLSLLSTDLATSKPVAGVSFQLLGTGFRATSNADGAAALAGPIPPRYEPPYVLVAQHEQDSTFEFGLYGAQSKPRPELRLHTFDDRQLYKPGETMRVKGIARRTGLLRGGDVSLPGGFAGQTLRYSARDATYAEIGRGTVTLDDAGGFELTLTFKDTVNLGNGTLTFERGDEIVGSHSFRIAEFRRPEYQVSAEVDAKPMIAGEFGVASAHASYYAGGALRAAETEWVVSRQSGSFSPPNRAEYNFGKRTGNLSWRTLVSERTAPATWSGRTDSNGTHRLRVDFEDTGPYPVTLALHANVTDQNHQAWSAETSMLVHPSSLYAGLKLQKPFVHAGDPIKLDVIASDLQGNFVKDQHVHLRSWRVTYEQERGEWVTRDADVSECDVQTKPGAFADACALTTGKAGLYGISAEITDAAGRLSRTVLDLWVTGENQEPARLRQNGLELTLDKPSYAPGDQAELLIKSPFAPAMAVVQIVGGQAPREERLTLTSRTQTITLPIGAGDVPGLQVRVALLGNEPRTDAHGEPAKDLPAKPAFAAQVIHLDVPPNDRNLAVTVTPRDRTSLPGATTRIAIDVGAAAAGVLGAREAAVYVVDESVLSLAGYTLADPKSAFYTQVGGLPQARDTRARVTLARVEQLRRLFAPPVLDYSPIPPTAPWGREESNGMWGDSLGDSFGRGGLGLSGSGAGGGGRGEGIGLGSIGAIGHGVRKNSAPMAPPRETEETRPAPIAAAAPSIAAADKAPRGPTSLPTTEAPKLIALRSNFEALAFWQGRLVTDANGHGEVELKMPESTTRFRVMAVAWDHGGAFGTGESNIVVQQPIMVRPSAPRFLNYGDQFALPVIVQNQANHPVQVTLATRAENATLTDPRGRRFSVAAGDRVELRVPARAGMPGSAMFDFAVSAKSPETGETTDAAHAEMPVWTPGTTEAFATYGTLDQEGDGAVGQAVEIPADLDKHWGGLEISTSSTALFALSDALLSLQRYPFECNEQLASRVLGVGTLRDMMRAFASAHTPSAAALQTSMNKDLLKLAQRQDPSSGGFGFWSRDRVSPYLSVHVAFAFSVAKQKGYDVAPQALANVQRYLDNIDGYIPAWYDEETRKSLLAYAAFVQERLGRANVSRAVALIDEPLEKNSIERLAWLLPTLAKDVGQKELTARIVRHFENRASETAGAAHFTTSYGEGDYLMLASDHRSDALVLYALLQADAKNQLLPKVVAGLLGARKKGHWQNTQEDAFVLLALDAYFHVFESVVPNFTAETWLGTQLASSHQFLGRNTDRAETEVPMELLASLGRSDLVVGKRGKGRLYYRLGLRYAPSDLVLPALERGFSVSRRYESLGDAGDVRRDEQGTWHVKLGASVRVHVDMVATSERHHVALVDPLPAGFEALNPALAGTAVVVPVNQPPTRSWSRYWYEHENLRDERAEAFTSLLWAGAHSYEYVVRATTPGNFVVPPSKAEEMYAPETFGRSAGDRVIVE